MNRSEIDKKIARLDALSGIIPPSAADQSERDLLVAERDLLIAARDDPRFEEQKAMRRSQAGRGRLGAKLMRKDLDIDEDSYRRLVHEVWEMWRTVMDDYEMRHDPDKPKRRLEDNYQTSGDLNPVYDYGDMAGLGWELNEWELWWREVYLGPPGRRWPRSEYRVPLRWVFFFLRRWWIENGKGKKFAPNYPSERREDFNMAGRLFLDIAQVLDDKYTAEDCKSVYENCRKTAR